MAEKTDKDVSPEEKLLNVIRGKGGATGAAKPKDAPASAIVDEPSPAIEPSAAPPPQATRSEPRPERAGLKLNRPSGDGGATRPVGTVRVPRPTSNVSRAAADGLQPPVPTSSVTGEGGARPSVADILRKRQGVGSSTSSVATASAVIGAAALSAAPMTKKRHADGLNVSKINWGLATAAALILLMTLFELSTVLRINTLDDEVAAATVSDGAPIQLAAPELPYDFSGVLSRFGKKMFFSQPADVEPPPPPPGGGGGGGGGGSTEVWIQYATENLQLVARMGQGEKQKVMISDKKRSGWTQIAKKGDRIDVGDTTVELKEIMSDRILLAYGRRECVVRSNK